ncbi:Putative UDP-glucose 4-epimerase [Chlamydiales bacterium SCGC AG-110-M15]|nr:Putative UDP-glucose 4-epimerase [Chlamydiales bacterium SCGC AG-110-M15]
MKALVTGGAGFIGSHLVDRLLDDGHHVTVLDSLITGRKENLPRHEHLIFHQVDISDINSIASFFEGIDWVFHMAALADIVPSIQEPHEYHRCNVDGTIAVLEASRNANVKRFLYTASSSCYGIPDEIPTSENAQIRCMYPYAFTKYIGECYAMHWHQVYKLPVVSLRLFNVYGPRSRTSGTYGAVFGVFLAQKLAKKAFTVVGDGKQTRDFTYVTDVAEAFVKAAEANIAGEIYNIGSGGSYSINELVDLLGGEVEYIPKRPGEPDATFADLTKIREALNWKAQVPFQEGVRKMLESIKLWESAPVWDKDSISEATKEWFQYLKD